MSKKPNIIMSSAVLMDALRKVDARHPVRFEYTTQSEPKVPGALVVHGEVRDWEPFEIPPAQMRKLYAILDELSEQPIHLEWDGSWLWMKHIILS